MAREQWSSGPGFVLASIGSVVGIGNIWRFPYMVGVNGGGAFLIPYLIALFLFGLPLLILELALGRHFRTSVVPAFGTRGRPFRLAGFVLVFILTMILSYYLVVTGWTLAYFAAFARGAPLSFTEFTGSYSPLLFFALSAGIAYGVVRSGVSRGIERLSWWLMPLLFALLALLVASALALPGAARGLAFYLTPDFSRLSDPLVWLAAFGQAFFSLGVGTGIMHTYGSYLGGGRLVRNALVIAAADLLVALLAGFMVFPIVFSFGLDPAAGVQLAFVTLPAVFAEMRFGGVLGAAFFLLLFAAALTSAVSMLEVPVATLIDAWGMARGRAAGVAGGAVVLLGLPSALSYTALRVELFGARLLDLKDFAFGTVGMVVAGVILSVSAGWFFDTRAVLEHLRLGPAWRRAFLALVRYFIPLALSANLVARLAGRG